MLCQCGGIQPGCRAGAVLIGLTFNVTCGVASESGCGDERLCPEGYALVPGGYGDDGGKSFGDLENHSMTLAQ